MAIRGRGARLALILALVHAASVAAATSAASLDQAARLDLEGKPQLAYAAYLAAAEAGEPEAEFNVAVMLDSGRGVRSDLAQAAVWYARAAAHGFPRAAYDLGLLYESGQGVPRNADLARAWFEAAKLPASLDHLRGRRFKASDSELRPTAPDLVAPSAGSKIKVEHRGVELVWTSPEQPEPAQYYVELRAVGESGSSEIFSTTSKVSSAYVEISGENKKFAWRVTTLEKRSGDYVASKWSLFQTD